MNTKKISYFKIGILLFLLSCETESAKNTPKPKYLRWIGDIKYDSSLDNESFSLCNDESQTYQYFNDSKGLEYNGEKIAIINLFNAQYNIVKKDETGLLRIRFIVNCNGKTGRFRVLGMDENFQQKEFHSSVRNKLLDITRSLDKWRPKKIEGVPIDYYQYLVFKLENGKILEILP